MWPLLNMCGKILPLSSSVLFESYLCNSNETEPSPIIRNFSSYLTGTNFSVPPM